MLPERSIAPYLELSVVLRSETSTHAATCQVLPREISPASIGRLATIADEYLIPMLAQVLDARANVANLASTSTATGE